MSIVARNQSFNFAKSFTQLLLCEAPLDVILCEDKAKKQDPCHSWFNVIKVAQDLSKIYLQDMAHLEQVRKLALNLFDSLQSLHQLGSYERGLLECAPLLHDLGLSQGVKRHNKTSMKMILNDTLLPLTFEERQIVANIARYHRRGLPKQKHYNLASLSKKTVNTIYALAGLLRIADAFDCLHNTVAAADFKLLTVKLTSNKEVVFECFSTSNTLIEQAFDKKKNLFEFFFKNKAVLKWVSQ
jgi:exopolyphosphatase/guanosine-5'-triphosphate,3'-diphosphate pyrophosphatase